MAIYGQELYALSDDIADRAHAGALYGDEPYIVHPRTVASYAINLGYPLEVAAACLLHDTVEDTDETRETLLAQGIPLVVVDAVSAVTWLGDGNDLQGKIDQARSHPLGHVTKFCDSSNNFITSIEDGSGLGHDLAFKWVRKYGTMITGLTLGLPTPKEASRFIERARRLDESLGV